MVKIVNTGCYRYYRTLSTLEVSNICQRRFPLSSMHVGDWKYNKGWIYSKLSGICVNLTTNAMYASFVVK
jgi:hypothetical protein